MLRTASLFALAILAASVAAETDRVIVTPPGAHLKDSIESAALRGLPVYLLPGKYPVKETIVLPNNTKLFGGNNFEQPDGGGATAIRNTENSNPIFRGAPGGKFEIRGIQFVGRNILDFRSLGERGWRTSSQVAVIRDCAFFYNESLLGRAQPEDRWTAIRLANHDFSLIERCNLNNYEGYCGIRIEGTRSPEDKSGKNTTQVKVSDCAIRCVKIGISLDRIDNTKITGNDFGSAILAGIDLGGRLYDSAGYSGIFTNTEIRDNHFENCKRAIAAFGYPRSSHRLENWGTRVESNGVLAFGPRTGAGDAVMEFSFCSGVSTSGNSIHFDGSSVPIGKVTAFRIYSCRGFRSIGDDVSHSAMGIEMSPEQVLADSGGNEGVFFLGGAMGAPYAAQLPALNYLKGDLRVVGRIEQEKKRFGAAGDWSGTTLSNAREIGFTGEMSPGDSARLIDLGPRATGILFLCVSDARGEWCSTFGIGSAGGRPRLARLSPEEVGGAFSLAWSNGELFYKTARTGNAPGRVRISGTFSGMR